MSTETQGLLDNREVELSSNVELNSSGVVNDATSSASPGLYVKKDALSPRNELESVTGGLELSGQPRVISTGPQVSNAPEVTSEMKAIQEAARRQADCFILARSGKFEELLAIAEVDASVLGFRDADNHGFIHWAALNGAAEFIEKILADGWPVDLRAKNGQTALMWAALKGHIKVMNILIKYGADIHAEDSLGANATILAIQHREMQSFLLLVAYDAKVLESRDANKCTLMHWAAYKGDLQAIKLLEYFRNPFDSLDAAGMMPLHRAVSACQLTVCDYLISKKSDPYARNNNGENCFDLAKKQENDYIKESLHSALRRIGVKPRLDEEDVEMQDNTADTDHLTGAAAEPVKDTSIRGSLRALKHDLFKDKSAQIMFPIFYLVCASIASFCYISEQRGSAWELVPNCAMLFEIACPSVLFIFIWCVKGDPGIIPSRPIGNSAIEELQTELKNQTSDNDTHADLSRVCTTCWVLKGLRTKHCSECNVCVQEFDHHCVWLNNCVGGGNHRRFISLAMVEFLTQLFHFLITWNVVRDSLPSDRMFFSSFFIAWTSMPIMCMLLLLHSFTLPWVFVLTGAQLKLVAQNMSTNEMMNIHRYEHFWQSDQIGGRQIRNPFDKGGVMSNCMDFWCSRNRSARGPPVKASDIAPAPTVFGGHSHGGKPCTGHH